MSQVVNIKLIPFGATIQTVINKKRASLDILQSLRVNNGLYIRRLCYSPVWFILSLC